MAAFQTLLYIAIAIGASCWAAIPYDKLELNIFDDRPRDFELHVFEATQKVERFFARDEILYGIAAGLLALNSTTLYVGPFAELTSLVRDTLGGRGEWRMRLTTAISTEVLHGITENEIRWMEATIRTIQDKTKLLDDSNPDLDNRKTIASIIHTDLSKMINFFDIKTSLFRRYPLIGTPPLIQLASLVALFSPIAQTLIPMEAKNPQIACKMYDVLMDYRPRTVAARLHKLSAETSNAEKTIFNSIVKAMALPYNQRGYNETSPATIDCEQGCKNRVSHCLTDTFGTVEYYVSNEYTSTCVTDLLKFIRYRVEKLFPIDLLDKLCVNRAPKIPTGFGWLTINLLRAYTYGELSGRSCKLNPSVGCDPYLILYINNEQVMKTAKKTQTFFYDVNSIFTSAKIPKTSIVKLEIWDASSRFWGRDALILSTVGNIDSFLNEPLRKGVYISGDVNSIETMSFWLNDYK